MLTLLMISSMMSSYMLMMVSHPLTIGLMLLTQTLSVALMTGFFNYNFWYSYIMFLIMIGGMLVLFIYMTSVASNEKFKYSPKIMFMLIIIMMMSLFIIIISDPFFININNLNMSMINTNTNFYLSLSKFLNAPMNIVFYSIIIYLLITLIAVVKITEIKSGPLRQTH